MAEKRDVVIFVVDVFKEIEESEITTEEVSITTEDGRTINCVVRPDGQTYATGGVMYDDLSDVHDRPHGELVYDVLAHELIENLLSTIDPENAPHHPSDALSKYATDEYPWMYKMEELDLAGHRLLLVAIDTENYNTLEIRNRIDTSISYFSKLENPFTRFVINMSFAVLPCQMSQDYHELMNYSDLEELRTGLEHNVAKYNVAFSSDDFGLFLDNWQDKSFVARRFILPLGYNIFRYGLEKNLDFSSGLEFNSPEGNWQGQFTNDALCNFLKECNHHTINNATELTDSENLEDIIVYPVAAAGNGGESSVDFPFAPAMFDGVVSVGAVKDEVSDPKDAKIYYSNPGEILMDGKYIDGKGKGTSFAAPRFSARAAIYLYNDGVGVATDQEGNVIRPTLGYAGFNGEWKNYRYSDFWNDENLNEKYKNELEKWPAPSG